jgi:hypothetical protein
MKDQKKSRTKTAEFGRTARWVPPQDWAAAPPDGETALQANSPASPELPTDGTFDRADQIPFAPKGRVEVFTESIEANIGYASLVRQLTETVRQRMTFYASEEGGRLSPEEIRAKVFPPALDPEEAKKMFHSLMRSPVDAVTFGELERLWESAPRVGERFWEYLKGQGRQEFETGHMAARAMFPMSQMKTPWDVARFLGVRESFVAEWQPKGGVELSLLDMLVQVYFQWQYWVEQVALRTLAVERSGRLYDQVWTKLFGGKTAQEGSASDGVPASVEDGLELAVRMADRFQRMYLRTLRPLQTFRRFAPVTINNAKQVNIAAEGGKQANISE